MANLSVLWSQLKEIWQHFGINQKVSVLLALLLTGAVIGGVMYWNSRPSFRLLYSGMSLTDAASAREKLEDERIPTQLRDSGRSIYVPASDVYRSRLLLAAEGLPDDSSAGFELFEKPKFGLTDFAHKVNYQRALQGELERTISSMNGITSCRVILVLPSEKIFASKEDKAASGSILLRLSGGTAISPTQVRSIRQLVGSSVSGMAASAITVTDQHGNMLSGASVDGEDGAQVAGAQLDQSMKLERALTLKAQEMLDIALGEGRSIVKVSAEMDYSKIEKTSETYDSEGKVVASETISTESSSEPSAASGGTVGITANVPVGDPGRMMLEQSTSKTKREDITSEYMVPSELEHTITSGARLKHLSVSVCLAKGEQERTPKQFKDIEEMVRTAVGCVTGPGRSDTVRVVELDFAPIEAVAAAAWWLQLPISLPSIGNGLIGFILLIGIIIVSRRSIARLSIQREDAGVPVGSLVGVGQDQFASTLPSGPPDSSPEMGLDHIARLAEQNPKAVAAWITNINQINS